MLFLVMVLSFRLDNICYRNWHGTTIQGIPNAI